MGSAALSLATARAEVAAVTDSAAGSGAEPGPRAVTDSASAFAADFEELFAAVGSAALFREGGPEHLTASCLVVDLDAEAVLLNHHRKAGLWGQFGGHVEARDDSLRSAACREALEESGLVSLSWFSPTAVDLHVHDLSQAFGRCSRHFDVVYAAGASVAETPVVSAESVDVKWFPLTSLPAALMPDLVVRLPELYAAAFVAAELRSPGRTSPRH